MPLKALKVRANLDTSAIGDVVLGCVDPVAFERFFHGLNARLTRDGADAQPEKKLIAEAVYHGLQMPIEPALRVETRRFIELTRIPSVRETMQTRFFGKDA